MLNFDRIFLQMNNRVVSWILFCILCMIWGSSFILMKYSRQGLTALEIAAVRIFFGGIVFFPFALFHIVKIPRNKMGFVILLGLCGNLFPAFLFAYAIANNMDSSLAGILNSLTPICVVVISMIFFKERNKRQKIIGVFIGFAGLCLLTIFQNNISFQQFGYSLLIVLATILYGLNVNIVSHYLRAQSPIHIATVSIGLMTIPSAIVLWQQGFLQLDFHNETIRSAIFASIILGVAGSSIATVLFYVLVKKAGGLFASLVTYGIPFIALIWGFWDGEKINLPEIFCLLIILFGVYLANRSEKNNQEFT